MNDRGFTLTELLVATAVIGVVMAGIFTLQQQGQLAYLLGAARVEVQQNARVALDVMTRELRSAQAVTSVPANCGTTGANTITFTDSGGTSITYALSGPVLQRAGGDLAGGVETFKLFCYDVNSVATGTASSVRSILIQLGTKSEQSTAATSASVIGQHATVESRVRLRNL